jgi:two-component system, OmpR family, response regulator
MESRKLIFIADDDQIINTLVVRNFTSDHYQVEAFNSGEDCLAAINRDPDLLILDYVFPSGEKGGSMNGMEVFRLIRDIRPRLPVIMLSGQDKGDVVLEFARLGIDDYIVKDNNLIENLGIAIKEILGN